jgi:hypothetical protein
MPVVSCRALYYRVVTSTIAPAAASLLRKDYDIPSRRRPVTCQRRSRPKRTRQITDSQGNAIAIAIDRRHAVFLTIRPKVRFVRAALVF